MLSTCPSSDAYAAEPHANTAIAAVFANPFQLIPVVSFLRSHFGAVSLC
jgi:hypothetical protein